MKKIISIILTAALLLSLAACAPSKTAEPTEPVAEETQPAEETPEAPEETPEAQAPEDVPEPPEDAEEKEPDQPEEDLWDGQPVYVYNGSTAALAIDPAGQVILEQEGAVFSLLRDSFTGEVRGILASDSAGAAWNRLYSCQGQLVCEGFSAASAACAAQVFWYQEDLASCTIRSLDGGEILWERLSSVTVLGQNLYVEQQYWNSPAMVLSQDGTLLQELDRGFSRVGTAYDSLGRAYLVLEAPDGTQGLIDENGSSLLSPFYEQVTGVSEGCALVQTGEEALAIDLETGEAVFRWNGAIHELLPEGAVVSDGANGCLLVDRQGSPLCSQSYNQLTVGREDGEASFLLGQYTDGTGTTWAVCLELDGTERFRVAVGFGGLTVLSSQWAVFDTGEVSGASMNRVYAAVHLATGETIQLPRLYSGIVPLQSGVFPDEEAEAYFWAGYTEGEQVLWDVLTSDGQPVLSGLEDGSYVGGGVFSCRQNDIQGLLRTDGVWMYQAQ